MCPLMLYTIWGKITLAILGLFIYIGKRNPAQMKSSEILVPFLAFLAGITLFAQLTFNTRFSHSLYALCESGDFSKVWLAFWASILLTKCIYDLTTYLFVPLFFRRESLDSVKNSFAHWGLSAFVVLLWVFLFAGKYTLDLFNYLIS